MIWRSEDGIRGTAKLIAGSKSLHEFVTLRTHNHKAAVVCVRLVAPAT